MKFIKLLVAVIYHRYILKNAKSSLCDLHHHTYITDMPFHEFMPERDIILDNIKTKRTLYTNACDELKKLK